MRRRARLHADQARWQLGEERQDLGAAQLRAGEHPALRVDAVHLEHVFGQVEPDRGNLSHG
jgi:hypothetical protein